ncbi:MAG: hypothetical protein ABS79_02675 [Planctomycetes bacterium SCN 63-9]|nr:MAG: hypothetical protein ABS79_02675 [Planctomycetes bacterium SCN 63-9]
MVAQRVKFRCTHCNRLLSAPVGRVGRAIACPKCVQAVTVPFVGLGAELEEGTPEPPSRPNQTAVEAESPSSSGTRGRPGESPELMGEIASTIPSEVLDIQPEDIRAEVPSLGINLSPEDRARFPIEEIQPEELPRSVELELLDLDAEFRTVSEPAKEETGAASFPPIEVEPTTSIAIHDIPVRRSGELILPASVVLAWSLFVLFAQAFAFIAGLLIGHYYWKHP